MIMVSTTVHKFDWFSNGHYWNSHIHTQSHALVATGQQLLPVEPTRHGRDMLQDMPYNWAEKSPWFPIDFPVLKCHNMGLSENVGLIFPMK